MNNQVYWTFPRDTLQRSIQIMRPNGRAGNEGLALWFGIDEGVEIKITHAIDLFGSGFRSSPQHMSLSKRAMGTLTDLAEKLDRYLVGQIHSHPGDFLNLSDLDMQSGIRTKNYLSFVCPYYAQRDLNGFDECGVHVYQGGQYRRLHSKECAQRFSTSSENISVLKCEVHL